MTLLAGALLPLLQTAGVLDLGEIAIDLGAIVSVTMSAVFLTMNISDMPTAIAEGRVPISEGACRHASSRHFRCRPRAIRGGP